MKFVHQKPIGLEERRLRFVDYAPNGQRCEGWLPVGEYEIGGVVFIRRDRDDDERVEARQLIDGTGHIRYLGELMFQDELRRQSHIGGNA